MLALATIFVKFNLPNATTWFYFSWLLAMALFFKFSRLLSMRNWDVLTLFLLVPGLLLIEDANTTPGRPEQLLWFGYLWLLGASLYFLVRCFIDLALVRRPALSPNLNLSGLAWLGGALFISLVAVAARQPSEKPETDAKTPALIDQMRKQGENLVNQQSRPAGPQDADHFEARSRVERTLAILCHLAIVAGLIFIGRRHFQDGHAGMAAATFYLLLPYTFVLLPNSPLQLGHWGHVWPAVLLIWAIAAYRLPLLAGLLLGLAAGTVFFPALLLPAWLSFYWRRGAGRFAAAFCLSAGLSLAAIGTTLWLSGDLAEIVRSTLALSDWQPWKEPTSEGFWTGIHWAYRFPVFLAYLAFVAGTAFWPTPKNLAHILATSAIVLIGIQFWYADRGGAYVLWYLPLLLLLMFRPNLSDRLPMPIQPETDWLARLGRALDRFSVRFLQVPETPVRVR